VAPTFLDILGVEVKEGRHSLLPWILDRAEAAEPRRYVVTESAGSIAVRTRNLKLIASRDSGQVSLFDLNTDPGETENLASSRRADLARLRSYLAEWQQGLEPTTPLQRELNEETLEGLKALGYLD